MSEPLEIRHTQSIIEGGASIKHNPCRVAETNSPHSTSKTVLSYVNTASVTKTLAPVNVGKFIRVGTIGALEKGVWPTRGNETRGQTQLRLQHKGED